MTKDLDELRDAIDAINRRLLDVLCERGTLMLRMAALKLHESDFFKDPMREANMLRAVLEENAGPYSDDAVAAIFREIFARSRELVVPAHAPKLKVLRHDGEADRVVRVGDVALGRGHQFVAGPCAVESEDVLDGAAEALAAAGVRLLRGGAFKPRTSPYAFQGLGAEGLAVLRRVADRHGMAVVTEVLDPRDVDTVCRHADMLQVGTRNMFNYPLLKELARCGKPVLLKRSFAATIEEFLLAAEYLFAGGNANVVFCERGIRTFEQETRNTLDLSAVPILHRQTGSPVIVDVSHAAGRRDILPDLTAAAFAAGAAGVMVEVHPTPAAALSDHAQQLTPAAFADMVRAIRRRFRQLARDVGA